MYVNVCQPQVFNQPNLHANEYHCDSVVKFPAYAMVPLVSCVHGPGKNKWIHDSWFIQRLMREFKDIFAKFCSQHIDHDGHDGDDGDDGGGGGGGGADDHDNHDDDHTDDSWKHKCLK